MSELIIEKVIGVSSEVEHHKIAALMIKEKEKAETLGKSTYHYSVGLVMGRDLLISSPSQNMDELRSVVTALRIK